MKTAVASLVVIALAGTVLAGVTTLAPTDLLANQVNEEIRPAGNTVDGTSGLSYIAAALSNGSDAVGSLPRSAGNYEDKDTLGVSILNMECSIDRIINYVSCYNDRLSSAEDANNVFTRYRNEIHLTLSSEVWREVETEPPAGSIRSYAYMDQKSDAHIDLDLVAESLPSGESSYVVTVFGWPATSPRL